MRVPSNGASVPGERARSFPINEVVAFEQDRNLASNHDVESAPSGEELVPRHREIIHHIVH